MHPAVAPERWAAIRALREGEAPTFPRLAAATGLNPATIRERAIRDDWPKRTYPKKGSKEDRAAEIDAIVADLPETFEAVSMDDLRQRLADMLPRQLAKIIALAERGIIDQTRLDGLLAMSRTLERSEALQLEQATEKQKKSDEELAELLAKLDDRVVELAIGYAKRLVAGECGPDLGGSGA